MWFRFSACSHYRMYNNNYDIHSADQQTVKKNNLLTFFSSYYRTTFLFFLSSALFLSSSHSRLCPTFFLFFAENDMAFCLLVHRLKEKVMSSFQAILYLSWGFLVLSYHTFCLISTKIFIHFPQYLCAIAVVRRCVNTLHQRSAFSALSFFIHPAFISLHFNGFPGSGSIRPSAPWQGSAIPVRSKARPLSALLPWAPPHLPRFSSIDPAFFSIFPWGISVLTWQNTRASDIVHKFISLLIPYFSWFLQSPVL